MNGPLPAVEEQARWLEEDLATHVGKPIFLFLHLSPFLVSADEPGLGHYDNIDEPARSWLLDLIRSYSVQWVFSGHSHFSFFNRIGDARSRLVPSTAFTRPGFCEVFSSSPPPERGRDDTAKLGFLLVRVIDGRARVHLIRTNGAIGEIAPEPQIISRISLDLPSSPLGITLRHPLAPSTEVPIAWQSTVRQPVRNDFPFLACVEAGVGHLRTPSHDLTNPAQLERLSMARDEGISLHATWIWSERSPAVAEASHYQDILDGVEINYPSETIPDDRCLDAVAAIGRETGLPVTLAPLLPKEIVPGKQHARTRIGYHLDELPAVNQRLADRGSSVDRVLCRVDAGQDPWEAILKTKDVASLGQIGAIDWAIEFGDVAHGEDQVARAVRALAAAATLPGSRLYLEPLVDLDRTMDAPLGLLDRLSNPRPVFHAVRLLNTILFSDGTHWSAATAPALANGTAITLTSAQSDLVIVLPNEGATTRLDPQSLDRGADSVVAVNILTGTARPIAFDRETDLTAQQPTVYLLERSAVTATA